MVNEITKYKNELNAVSFNKFNARELDLFFAIVSRMRDKDTERVTFSFKELHSLSKSSQHSKRFINDLTSTYQKMLHLGISYGDEHHIKAWVLFTTFDIDIDNETVSIRVNPDLKDILNNFTIETHWTRFSLQQFTSLHSVYAKNAFRLFKQFRTLGVVKYSKEEFARLLVIPKSYRQKDIDRRILQPIKEELSPIFKNLKITKRYGKGRGKPVIGYQFTFTPEKRDKDDFNIDSAANYSAKITNIMNNKDLSSEDKVKLLQRLHNEHFANIPTHLDFFELQEVMSAILEEKNAWQKLSENDHSAFIKDKINEVTELFKKYQKQLLN